MLPAFTLFLLLPILFVPTSLGVLNPGLPVRPSDATGLLFGPRPCLQEETTTFFIGDVDNFGDVDQTSPRPALDAWLAGLGVPRRQFDEGGVDKHFAHTVTGLPANLLSASLTMRVSGVGALSANDGVGLQFIAGGSFHQPAALATLVLGWPTTGLATIPFSATLLYAVDAAGYLDVYVQDDAMVDYLELTVIHCVCDGPAGTVSLEQGTADNFAGIEPTTPRLALAQWVPTPVRQYDEGGPDKRFATTLVLPDRACLLRAVLEVRLESQDALVTTDGISLLYTGGTPPFAHSEPLAYTGVQTLTFDLGSLPGAPTFLQDMAAAGLLDVYIQDDSSVDYVALTLTYG